jgi:hypothetical protein
MTTLIELAERSFGLHEKMAQSHPSLRRGMVWCTVCGVSQRVDSAGALRHGWPKHCGYTMTIDSPEDRARLARAAQGNAS